MLRYSCHRPTNLICQTREIVKIVITGGGTGGHVAPALAVVDALRALDPSVDLLYIGSNAGIEARLAVEAGVRFTGIATGKMRRSSNPLKMLNKRNVIDAFRVPLGLVQAIKTVRTFRPDAVLSTGGYVCVPTVLAAWLLRIPVITHEQTVTVGLANRIAGRVAARIALAFPDSMDLLPRSLARKATVTGNPLRNELFTGSADNPQRFGFDQADNALPFVYVTGGAQGAHIINTAIADCAAELVQHARVLHQCGTNDAEDLRHQRDRLEPEDASRWQLRPFVERDEIGDAWALADLVVARAGAGTVSEACALAKPVVFIPLEPSSGDEQLKNAQRSVAAGGALVLRQADCNAANLLKTLLPLLVPGSATRRQEMGAANGKLAAPNAADELAHMLVELAAR